MDVFTFSFMDLLLTTLGLPLFLVDIVLDVLAAVNFYEEEAYVCLGVLLLLLIGSSLLTQIYSWLWYKYDDFKMETKVEKCMRPGLKTLHFLQMGVYVRHAGVLETSVNSFRNRNDSKDKTVYLNHDLAMLRIFETFSESAPQIVLMLTIILQRGQLDFTTVLKTLGSMSVVALCVTSYHRCLRSFLPDKAKSSIVSSIVYFFWNLLLLLSRLVALSLFASVQPCYIFAHFISSWLVLFFCAWRVKTHFMESVFGEWLYRATVGLIWYFDWFSAVKGKTRNKTLIYHSYILADISVLCGVWYWKMSTNPPHFVVPPLYAAITAASVVGVYILGLFFKLIYYKFFHPNLEKDELKGNTDMMSDTVDGLNMMMFQASPDFNGVTDRRPGRSAHCNNDELKGNTDMMSDTVDGHIMVKFQASPGLNDVTDRSLPSQSAHCNKRMKRLAENFYS